MKNIRKFGLAFLACFSLIGCSPKEEPSSSSPASSHEPEISSSVKEDKTSSSSEVITPKEEEVSLTFHWNADGLEDTHAVAAKGSYLPFPEMKERTGYRFSYWALDAAGTQIYDLGKTLDADTVLYAIWIAEDANCITITFHNNYEGATSDVYMKMSIAKDSRLKAFPGIARQNHDFKGWYTSTTYEKAVSKITKYSADTDLYARWFNIDVLEAEYTKLTDLTYEEDPNINDFGEKIGHGYSSDVSGTGLIFKENANLKASNGYFICDLYYKEAFIQFDITSDKEVTDATLTATLSAEYFDMTFTKDNWIVSVNGTSIDYGTIVLDNVPSGRDSANKRPFSTHNLTNSLHLNQGKNTIKLITNNSTRHDSTGTMAAEAPMIDCLTISSSATIDFDAHTDNIA